MTNTMSKHRKPWVARITGSHPAYGLDREFLDGQIDYQDSNSFGSRGVTLLFLLEPGFYEIRCFESWRSEDRYFGQVSEAGELERVGKDIVVEWAEEETERIEAERYYRGR